GLRASQARRPFLIAQTIQPGAELSAPMCISPAALVRPILLATARTAEIQSVIIVLVTFADKILTVENNPPLYRGPVPLEGECVARLAFSRGIFAPRFCRSCGREHQGGLGRRMANGPR